MNYIVLDLEWNQPISYHSPAYKSVRGKLLFELIQIGAVRVNEQMEVTDSFNQLIQPQHYVKLHPRIARITHIDQESLADAPLFPEALAAFAAWCGQDYVLLTWGPDDISVLNQNMTFYQVDTVLSKIYDLQKLFGDFAGQPKDRKGLKAAMEQLEINPDEENMPFHNAVNDAYYTALVFARMPEPQKVLDYPLVPRKLQHLDKKKRENTAILRVRSMKDAMKSSAVPHLRQAHGGAGGICATEKRPVHGPGRLSPARPGFRQAGLWQKRRGQANHDPFRHPVRGAEQGLRAYQAPAMGTENRPPAGC